MAKRSVLVLGVGNESRGDDAVGPVVARRLKGRRIEGLTARECTGDGTALLDEWNEAESVVIIDAASSGAAPGTIFRFDATAGAIPADTFAASTHALGAAQAIEMARALGRLPPRLIVIGIEGARFEQGEWLSPAVEGAVDRAVRCVLDEVAVLQATSEVPG